LTTRPLPTLSFRRRVDNIVLRWQARLDSDWADRVLPWLFAGGLFLLLELLALAKARSLDGTVDLAVYSQAAFLIHNGQTPVITITSGSHLMASQAAFAFYPLSLLTFVLPIQPALLLLQSGALAFAAVPIWRIARRLANLRAGAAFVLMIVYGLYPTMHNLDLAGFYPETLALPTLLWAAYFGLAKHWRRYFACCLFIVLCRADFGLAVAGLGGLLWAEGRKVEGKVSVVLGVLYTAIAVLVIQPRFGSGSYAHISVFSAFGDTPGAVMWGMITHPGEVAGAVFREQNFNLLVTLFAPVAFLPFLAPRDLLPVLPLQFFFLVASVPEPAVYGQQTVAITAFIFLSAAFALGRIGRMGVERITVDRRVLAVMLLSATLFFVRDAASSPYRHPWAWGGRDAADSARLEAADRIGPTRSVRASPSVLTAVAERERVYVLVPGPRPDAVAAADGVDAVILDDRTVETWTAVDRRVFNDGLVAIGFNHEWSSDGIDVYIKE
jgi:uncharacterized membrane protein